MLEKIMELIVYSIIGIFAIIMFIGVNITAYDAIIDGRYGEAIFMSLIAVFVDASIIYLLVIKGK